MKVLILLGLLVCAFAQKANWDLAEVKADLSSHLDWSKIAASVGGNNQGYKARYTQQGKLLKLSLNVHKEKDVRVTDVDRLLFGMEGSTEEHEHAMANWTMTRKDTAALCERALGSEWHTMVQLPSEELSYVESLRLAASLNEYNVLRAGGSISKVKRGYGSYEEGGTGPSDFDCICHGTNHRFPWSTHDNVAFWGVRVLQRYTRHTNPGHSPHGAPNCILCDHLGFETDSNDIGYDFDCRWCCYGECVVSGSATPLTPNSNNPGWVDCDSDFMFDSLRTHTSDVTFNYYRINDVGRCRLPRVYHCVEEVHRHCGSCGAFLDQLTDGTDSDSNEFAAEFQACAYCDLVVGANPYICNNCSHSISNIESYSTSFRDSDVAVGGCNCENAMWQIANSPRYNHQGDRGYDYRGYDYRGYDYRGYDYRGDGYEGDRHENEGDRHGFEGYDYRSDYRG